MQIYTVASEQEASQALAHKLSQQPKTLFMLPGGSAAQVGIDALKLLTKQQLSTTACTLTDERFGAVDHADSNAKLLTKLGIPKTQAFLAVLQNNGMQETANNWELSLKNYIADGYHVVALFGIGTDNHIAGIKPGFSFDDQRLTAAYTADDFKRITIAPAFFALIDYAYIYAQGAQKKPAVDSLLKTTSCTSQPSQLVKDSKNFFVYYKQ